MDPEVITARLEEVRRVGWLWTTDGYALGVTTVAAAVRDQDGRPVASLHAHGPTFRFPPDEHRDAIGRSVGSRAAAIGAVLGWRHG